MDPKLKAKLSAKNKWIRFIYLILYAIIVAIAKYLVYLTALIQFIVVLFTDEPILGLKEFGDNLSVYIGQVYRFMTYNTDVMPFPFNPWPANNKGHAPGSKESSSPKRSRKK